MCLHRALRVIGPARYPAARSDAGQGRLAGVIILATVPLTDGSETSSYAGASSVQCRQAPTRSPRQFPIARSAGVIHQMPARTKAPMIAVDG